MDFQLSAVFTGATASMSVGAGPSVNVVWERFPLSLWPPPRLCPFFPNQAALEGFLQSGLRNRIREPEGTSSPVLHFGGSPGCLSVPQ